MPDANIAKPKSLLATTSASSGRLTVRVCEFGDTSTGNFDFDDTTDIDWDKNWVRTQVIIKCGKFSGQYLGEFMTVDFEKR